MKTEKLYIRALQTVSFKAFAIIAYILLFVFQRIPQLTIDAVELRDVSEGFSISNIALMRMFKFFDYFAAEPTGMAYALAFFCITVLVLGMVSLCLSLFKRRTVQLVNFILSFLGSILSIILAILFCVGSTSLNYSDVGEIMDFAPVYGLIWLPPLIYMVGTLFTYIYIKMPEYTLAEGRLLNTAAAALDPHFFMRTFTVWDNTEALYRASVPLKKKKYATISEPEAVRRVKKQNKEAEKRVKGDEAESVKAPESRKLTPLEIALKKREHAEKIANTNADAENRALLRKKAETGQEKERASRFKLPSKPDLPLISKREKEEEPQSARSRALEIAKQKALHAEEVAARNRF